MAVLKRLTQEFLLVSPLVLLLSVSVGTRTHVDTFEPVEYPSWLQQRVLGYIEPMRAYEKLKSKGDLVGMPDETCAMAMHWVQEFKQGRLQELPAVHAEDNMRDGVKGQISGAIDDMAWALSKIAEQYRITGMPAKAASRLALGMELTQFGKYNDLYSVAQLGQRQRKLLGQLEELMFELDASEIVALKDRLDAVRSTDRSLSPLVVRARQLAEIHREAMGEEPSPIEEVGRVVYAGNLIHESAEKVDVSRALQELTLVYSGGTIPDFIPETRFAWSAQDSQIKDFDRVLNGLNGRLKALASSQ